MLADQTNRRPSFAGDLAKRSFDIAASLVGLIVLAPLFGIVAVSIKLDSTGPIFFRQVRVGCHGREFQIWKFRTMVTEQRSDAPQVTSAGDTRITRTGAQLRKFKIDELPQLINVTLGEMSLVGPRPEVPRYVALYPPEVRDLVLSVRPGITDLASITYRDENDLLAEADDPVRTYVETVLPIKLHLCQEYVRSRSFMGDLQLIVRTIAAVISR